MSVTMVRDWIGRRMRNFGLHGTSGWWDAGTDNRERSMGTKNQCRYCRGDETNMTVLHHWPVDLLVTLYDLPHDPIQRYLADRNDGAQCLLTWLHKNGYEIVKR